jgi:hypothetical protein
MKSTSEGVRCTVHDGSVWMHLDDSCVEIPASILGDSHTLRNLLTFVDDLAVNRDFTLAVPCEWLKAWAACFCERKPSRCTDTRDLVNLLMVCF